MEFLFIILLFTILSPIIIVLLCQHREQKLDETFTNTEYAKITNKTRREVLADKGAYGEYQLFSLVDPLLTGTKYWLFNVYIPRGNGDTTEIDAILFHDSGIYIFESKNYKGWIFGHEEHKTWTQCLRSSGRHSKKFTFFNPLMQNNIHIACFKALAGQDLDNILIRSVVLFGDQCQLKNLTLTSGHHYVLNQYMLPNLLAHLVTTTPPVDVAALTRLYQRVYPFSQVDEATRQQHIVTRQTQSRIQRQRKQTYHTFPVSQSSRTASTNAHLQPICPRCGATLVKRTVQKGERKGQTFLGCSNYPRCRYTKS